MCVAYWVITSDCRRWQTPLWGRGGHHDPCTLQAVESHLDGSPSSWWWWQFVFDDDNDLWWWWWCWLWWRRAGLSKLVYIWVETLCGNTTRIIFGFWFWKSLPYLFQSSVLSDKVLELSRAVLGFQHLHSNPMMSLIFFYKRLSQWPRKNTSCSWRS